MVIFIVRCDYQSWWLYENGFVPQAELPGLVDYLGGCLAEARLGGESGPKG